MEDTIKIRLNKSVSKNSTSRKTALNLNLSGKQSLIPHDDMYGNISLDAVYEDERSSCEKVRLICEINPVTTNVLYNNVTEVVINEGNKDAKLLNIVESAGSSLTKNGKTPTFKWTAYECTRDTQLSSLDNVTFHCGKDIFNNHIFRGPQSTVILPYSSSVNDYFNTLFDVQRNSKGRIIPRDNSISTYFPQQQVDRDYTHVYTTVDTLTFSDSVEYNLKEYNGWVGFYNPAKLQIIGGVTPGNTEINRVINNTRGGAFISMYPGMDEYTIVPRYNKEMDRYENNWNYCLTYPSSSTTKGFVFINEELGSLRIFNINTNESKTDGTKETLIMTYCVHGLVDGDSVNIYNNKESIVMGAVVEYVDDYTFSINDSTIFDSINFSAGTNDFSFKKCEYGVECEYYVRIFSRLPNFKFSEEEVTYENLYKEGSTLIEDNQRVDFDSSLSKLAFAKNSYNDDMVEIVFTDDIEISSLVDNLGRPLSEIFLTIVKNNKGYSEWYSTGKGSVDVEYSHCFGKLNCGIKLSDAVTYAESADTQNSNIWTMNNIEGKSGFTISDIDKVPVHKNGKSYNDEIDYYTQNNFYGDLCCLSKYDANEEILDDVFFRFNTAQRELNKPTVETWNLKFDEITSDDYGLSAELPEEEGIRQLRTFNNGIMTGVTMAYSGATRAKEGYYYKPHNRIKVREVSSEPHEITGDIFRCFNISGDNNTYNVTVTQTIVAMLGEKLILFNTETFEYAEATVVGINSDYRVTVETDFNFPTTKYEGDTVIDLSVLVLVKKPSDVASYATFVNDGSCRYVWRDIIQNGMDITSSEEEYPFANGRIYITKKFNLYLRRQDPHFELIGKYMTITGDSSGKIPKERTNRAFNKTENNDTEC